MFRNKLAAILFVFATFNAYEAYKVQDGFYFDPAPVNQDIIDGDGTKMRCDVSNRNSISFYWTMNGVRLANVSRRFQDGSDLKFLWVNRALDNGTFHCIATNVSTGIALQSLSARLNILWIDENAEVQLIKPEDRLKIVEGSEVVLKCNIDGNEEPQIEWFKNKIRITNSERIKIQKGKLLKMTNVNSGDNGVYSCKGRNSPGTTTSNVDFIMNIQGSNNVQLITDNFKEFLLVNRGTTAFLNCQYPPEELADLSWLHDKNKLDSSEKFVIHENGTLEIRSVEKFNEGVYRCSVNFKAGGSQTYAVELKTSYLEEFTSRDLIPRATPESHVVPRGGRYSARCYPPDGLPKPTVKWYDPSGIEIEVDRRKPLYFTEGVISFANIQPTNAGKYKCVAENSAGQVHQFVELAVSEPSNITRSPLSDRVKEGALANFDCKVSGSKYPITKIGWMFEEKPLQQNSKYTMDERNGILTIKDVEPADEGNYICYTKTIGQPTVVSGNAFLYVEKRLKFDPMPSDSYVELGESDGVECKASGTSHPSITWYREGRQPLQKGVASSDGQLVFEKVQVTDAGRYSCYANAGDESINTTVNVYTTIKPRLKIKPINTTTVEGSSVVMHCVAIGDPVPQVDWYKNAWTNELDKNRFKIFPNGTLILSTAFAEDSGVYGCAASSPSATVREEAYLSVITKDENDAKLPEGKLSTTMIAIVACVVIVVLIVILVIVFTRKRKNRGKDGDVEKGTPLKDNCGNNYQKSPEQVSLMHGREPYKGGSQADGSETRSHVSGVSSQQSHVSNTLSKSFKPFDKYIFSRTFLNNFGRLGAGNFGEVYIAEAYNVVPGVTESLVMVKVLFTKDENHRNEFIESMDMFSKTNHPNFSKLLAVCVDDPYSAVFEYTDCGILKKYLEAGRPRKDDTKDRSVVLKNIDKLNICLQVAQAMDYLNNQLKLYHKDLAARNVLITSTFSIKIASLGLTQDLYVNEYFSFQNKSLPIRWMSPESLLKEYKRDSTASDAWSFGVFMWEVYTLACLPMSDKTNEMVIEGLTKDGNVELPYPPGCPPEIWSLITMCRNFDPQARPSFSDMTLALSQCIPTDIIA